MLPAIMDISARAISLADRPQWAILVTSVRMRREDRSSISADPLADLGSQCVLFGQLFRLRDQTLSSPWDSFCYSPTGKIRACIERSTNKGRLQTGLRTASLSTAEVESCHSCRAPSSGSDLGTLLDREAFEHRR